MTLRLSNKTALITGGASGIGASCVRRFVAEGAKVLLGDINETSGKKLAEEFNDNVHFQLLDVGDESSFNAAIQKAVERWGHLDILVNNAGVVFPAEPIQRTSLADFEMLIRVNLRSVFLGSKLAYPYLQKSKGCILNISSMAGVCGQENHAIYAATKGGINALTKSMAVDWGKEGIRINALCPTGVWTEALRSWSNQQLNPTEIESYLNRIHALNYCPEPEEIASVAVFLCSPDAKFVTGSIMPVSGGSECGYRL